MNICISKEKTEPRSQCRAHLWELSPVKRLVALENLSSEVAVLPVQFLWRHNMTTIRRHNSQGWILKNAAAEYCSGLHCVEITLLLSPKPYLASSKNVKLDVMRSSSQLLESWCSSCTVISVWICVNGWMRG